MTRLRDSGEAATRQEGSRFTVEGRTGKDSGYNGHQEKELSPWPQGFLTSVFLELRVMGKAEGTENPGRSQGQPDTKPALSDTCGFERASQPLTPVSSPVRHGWYQGAPRA